MARFTSYINRYKISNTTFLQVGDFGVGFNDDDNEIILNLNEKLENLNIFLYIIRGNHDDPFFFREKTINKWSNIIFLPDYTVLKYLDECILCIGGAVSIDRKLRQKQTAISRKPYWFRKETFNYQKELVDKILEENNITVMVTHTAPASFAPYHGTEYPQPVKEYLKIDKLLHNDLTEERNTLERLYNQVKGGNIKLWVYGHFHFSNSEKIGNIQVTLLDVDEFIDSRLDM